MIDEKLKAAIERALAAGFRVQLKRMKDGTVKAQIIKAEELKKKYRYRSINATNLLQILI